MHVGKIVVPPVFLLSLMKWQFIQKNSYSSLFLSHDFGQLIFLTQATKYRLISSDLSLEKVKFAIHSC